MSVKITRDKNRIAQKIAAGKRAATIAVTEAIIEYGNIYVREDQGVLMASSLIGTTITDSVNRSDWTDEDKKNYSAASGSRPEEGLAIWDTPYAKKVYYTGSPSKDRNPNASLQWAEAGVSAHKKELDQIAQNAFTKGMEK